MRRFSLDSLITRLEKFAACPWLVLEYFFFIIIILASLLFYFVLWQSFFTRAYLLKNNFLKKIFERRFAEEVLGAKRWGYFLFIYLFFN